MIKITNTEDLVKLARKVIEEAQNVNDQKTILILESALKSGYSASENLGSLRDAFDKLIDAMDFSLYPQGTKLEFKEAIKEIDKAFHRANRSY